MDVESSELIHIAVRRAIDAMAAGDISIYLPTHVREAMHRLRDQGATSFALTTLLRSHLLRLAEDKSETRLHLYLGAVYERLCYWMQEIQRWPMGRERARLVHAQIDQAIRETDQLAPREQNVSCRKACSYCCHTPVSIGASEGILIEDFARENKIEWDAARARRQSEAHDPQLYRQALSWEEAACVFLSDQGSCQIYAARPISCRKLSVVSEPKLCDPREINAPSYLMQFEAETIGAAFYNLEFGPKAWPPSLPAYLARPGQGATPI